MGAEAVTAASAVGPATPVVHDVGVADLGQVPHVHDERPSADAAVVPDDLPLVASRP